MPSFTVFRNRVFSLNLRSRNLGEEGKNANLPCSCFLAVSTSFCILINGFPWTTLKELTTFLPEFADFTTLYGTASPPTSYGGYGGNAKESAK